MNAAHATQVSAGTVLIALIEILGNSLTTKDREHLSTMLKNRRIQTGGSRARAMTIGLLCRSYCRHAKIYYRSHDGRRTEEARSISYALRPLKARFSTLPVQDFGPLKLKQIREDMIGRGWCRIGINQQIGRIKRMFKWAVSEELIAADIFQGIQTVAGLRAGRSTAAESKPVRPAPEPLIEAVLPRVSEQVKAMIQLQLLTGMRPGEVLVMRTVDIDRQEPVWCYTPLRHKTEHHGHQRIVLLGPKAQEVIRPFLSLQKPHRHLFRPVDAERVRRERLHALRCTPMSCGNTPGSNKIRHPEKRPGQFYTTLTYARAIPQPTRSFFSHEESR